MSIEQKKRFVVHPKTMIVWMFIITVIMAFAALTSAMIVSKGQGGWMEFEVPKVFSLSTGLIILSSVVLHVGYLALKKSNKSLAIIMVVLTMLLGVGFAISQWQGWGDLVRQNVFFAGEYANAGGSFIYVVTWLHLVHILAGFIYLIFVAVLTNSTEPGEKQQRIYRNGASFWHFLGILWLYLYIFLIINYQ